MRWIEVHSIRVTPNGKVAMVVKATGKPLVLSMSSVRHRNGNMILVDDWLHNKLAPYLEPGGNSDDGRQAEGDRHFSLPA